MSKNKIFISYRSDDTQAEADWLYNEIYRAYPDEDLIFKDRRSIKKGDDFEKSIKEAISQCSLVLVLVGNQFFSIVNEETGNVRLTENTDWVKREIRLALGNDIKIIPICFNNAKYPSAEQQEQFPDEIKDFLKLQKLNIATNTFQKELKGKLFPLIEENLTVSSLNEKIKNKFKTLFEEDSRIKLKGNTVSFKSQRYGTFYLLMLVLLGIGAYYLTLDLLQEATFKIPMCIIGIFYLLFCLYLSFSTRNVLIDVKGNTIVDSKQKQRIFKLTDLTDENRQGLTYNKAERLKMKTSNFLHLNIRNSTPIPLIRSKSDRQNKEIRDLIAYVYSKVQDG